MRSNGYQKFLVVIKGLGMDYFKAELERYSGITAGDLSANQKEHLKRYLSEIKPNDLHDIGDHKDFLKLLKLLRSAMLKDLKLIGENFVKTLESLLSVGTDGVYSNSLRFLYELIQNVDDCEYEDPQNCVLDIKFDTCRDLIELTYNEKGFTPENVIAITGIAEKAKNISANKIEIGEKGIGFKSVFGIAESVHIQSGFFSFKLFRGNFIVPIPEYDSFSGVNGTKLILKLKYKFCYSIYQEIVKQYSQSSVLLNKNPILFLNKLTNVRLFVDDNYRYMKFHVSRTPPIAIGNRIEFEENVLVSVDIANPDRQPIKNAIQCYRYKMPIVYNRVACTSRYSEETQFQSKRHYLVAVFPHVNELGKIEKKGSLYSFLPTQIKLSVPLMLHAPYKLDVSREYIDSQSENTWFAYTNSQSGEFLKLVYENLAIRVKESIVNYLPRLSEYIFIFDNEKTSCLQKDCFCGRAILNQKLFFTADNTFEKAEDVISFHPNENIDDPISMYLLLSPTEKLFLPTGRDDMSAYGVQVVEDAYGQLFKKAIYDANITGDALTVLASKTDFDYDKAVNGLDTFLLSVGQVAEISKYNIILTAFQNHAVDKIKKCMLPNFDCTD